MKPATDAQKNKLKELEIEFDPEICFDDARDLLRESLPQVEKINLSKKPELYESLIVRSEADGMKYNEDIKYLP